MDYKKLTYDTLEKIYSKDYNNTFDNDLMSIIQNHPFINELFVNALNPDGHGCYFQFLKEIISVAKPSHIVELGNREGMSTLSIVNGMRKINNNCMFTTVDIVNDLRYMPDFVKQQNNINFVFGDCLSPTTLEKVKNKGPIDILFIDTIHNQNQLRAEWNTYEHLLADEALVLIDDVNLEDKVVAFNEIEHEKINDTRFHVSGFGVVFFKRELK